MNRKLEGLFEGITVDEARLAQIRKRPLPDNRYLIFFTPRSGSSRLGDLIAQTGHLANPGEPFNPAFVPTIARKMEAADLESYVDHLMRMRFTNGVFGAEATHGHVRSVFGSMEEILRLVRPRSCMWLIREDIVAQAVSLSRLKQTQVAHSPTANQSAQENAEAVFAYDPQEILGAVKGLALQEERMEEDFARCGVDPLLRLSYEHTTRAAERDLLALLSRHIGVDLPERAELHSSFSKLKSTKANEFTTRFRTENADLVAEIDARRAKWISKLAVIPASAG
jgi:LPS sulfotransferase NodH